MKPLRLEDGILHILNLEITAMQLTSFVEYVNKTTQFSWNIQDKFFLTPNRPDTKKIQGTGETTIQG